jgi:hypothetical protein
VHLKKNAHEHTGSAETLRPSLRNGFTAYSALSPVTGFVATVAYGIVFRKLDTSIGVSGPHDFAVSFSFARPRAIGAHDAAASIASRLAFRDDCAYAPLVRRDGASW